MTALTLSTAAAAAGGLRMFGLPWWFPLALPPPLGVVLFVLLGTLQGRRLDTEGSDDRG